MTEYLNVGKIVNTHGVQGELRVMSVTDFAEERFQVGNELTMFKPGETKPTKVKILTHRQHKNFDLITLENVYNLKLAEELKNSELKIEKDRVQALPEGEYYYHEILGCVAGDDTVICVAKTEKNAMQLSEKINLMVKN